MSRKTRSASERERLLLFQHGTKPWKLPPTAVLSTARRDLHKRESKGHHRYGFLSRHVRQAKSAADLLRRAIDDRQRGLETGRIDTLRIYSDEAILREAWKIAFDFEAGAK